MFVHLFNRRLQHKANKFPENRQLCVVSVIFNGQNGAEIIFSPEIILSEFLQSGFSKFRDDFFAVEIVVSEFIDFIDLFEFVPECGNESIERVTNDQQTVTNRIQSAAKLLF